MSRTYLGTRSGVYRLDDDQLTCLGLEQLAFEAIYALDVPGDSDTILAGSYGEGMFRSDDGGATWLPANVGLTVPALRTFMASPAGDGAILCGGEPGRGFRSIDQGRSWQELAGIAAIPNSAAWYLPYSPRAGALRNFYVPPRCLDHLYASIEVGGLLFSPDGGKSWTMLQTFDNDIHHVTGHPERPDEVWLALGWAGLPGRPDPDRARFGGVGGAPGRGASASTSAISVRRADSSASTAARSGSAAAQRARQRRTVFGEQSTCCALCSLATPAAAARTIWLRRTRAWGALCWRSKRSRIARWGGEMVMGSGGGPGIGLLSRTQGDHRGDFLSKPGLYRNPVRISPEL